MALLAAVLGEGQPLPGRRAVLLDDHRHVVGLAEKMLLDDLRLARDVGELELDHDRLEKLEHRACSRLTRSSSRKLRLGRGLGLLEAMVVEPVGVAHLDEARRRVAHEQQLLVAEAVGEVGEERGLPAGDPERVVHEAARLGLVAERHPRRAPLRRMRLLPGMREIEGVAHLVAGGPEAHPRHPGGRRRRRPRAAPR